MGIVYGLFAALGWGLADYIITCLTRRVGTARAMVYAQGFSLLVWLVLLVIPAQILLGDNGAVKWSGLAQSVNGMPVWAWAIGAGICHVVGLVLSYRAFEIGTLALVSPMASSFAIVTAVLSVATHRDVLPPPIIAGVIFLFCGILLATRAPAHGDESNKGLRGVPEALGCAVGFGVMFWMMEPINEHLGDVVPLIVLKLMSSSIALVGLRAAKQGIAPLSPEDSAPVPWGIVLQLALGIAIVDALAWLAFIHGEATQYTTVVTALASLFSVVTILLAWLLLKERLARIQWVGIAVILGGVLVVSAADQLNAVLKNLGLLR